MLLLFRYVILKIFILICLYAPPIKAQSDIDFLNSIFNKIYINLGFYKLISYDLKITTLEANNTTSTYTAKVTEIYDDDSNYILYKLNNNQIFFSYSNILGLQRFWIGKINDLPEIHFKDIDNKILTTAISYSNLNINPLWFNIPINYKNDQGFLVIQSYSKNLFTHFPKVEFYINKENIPIRVLYYNKISSFPILETLVNDYKKEKNGFIIYKIEYKDNYSKKVTIIEKSNLSFDPSMPEWFESIVSMINNNITSYYNSFMISIRDKRNISELNKYFNNITLKDDNKNHDINKNEQFPEKNPKLLLTLPDNNTSPNKENRNTLLLKELDSLNSSTFKESQDSLLFNATPLSNKSNSDTKNNETVKQKKFDSKIKHNKLDNKKHTLNNSKNYAKLEGKQNNIIKKKDLNQLTTKNTINSKSSLGSKNLDKKPPKDFPLVNTKNPVKNIYDKEDKNLKSKESILKSIPDNKENFNNKETTTDIPLKKEKKKNLLNNLF